MCLAWGLTPDRYDGLPRQVRREMWDFWLWKHRREQQLVQVRQLNARFFRDGR